MHRSLSLILLLCCALTMTACSVAKVPVAISGRVVVVEDGRPLANHGPASSITGVTIVHKPWQRD